MDARLAAAKASARNGTDTAPLTVRLRASLEEATKRLAAAKKKVRDYLEIQRLDYSRPVSFRGIRYIVGVSSVPGRDA